MPCAAVPREKPRAIQPPGSVGILSAANRYLPLRAPTMPVITAKTAANAGMPPILSAMPIATGAVTDFGASDSTTSRGSPTDQPSASGSALALGWSVGLPLDVVLSLAPKSVTAPVAMGIADKIGGIPALAAVFAVITGMVGALSGKYLFAALKIPTDPGGWMARGFSLGTAAHGIGAARALQVNADAGAYAGLALGLQVVLASLLIPLL